MSAAKLDGGARAGHERAAPTPSHNAESIQRLREAQRHYADARVDDGLACSRRAYDIASSTQPADPTSMVLALSFIAEGYRALGDEARSFDTVEAAMVLRFARPEVGAHSVYQQIERAFMEGHAQRGHAGDASSWLLASVVRHVDARGPLASELAVKLQHRAEEAEEDHEAALMLYGVVARYREATLGLHDPALLPLLTRIAVIERAVGRMREAAEHFEHALVSAVLAFGEEDPALVLPLSHLALARCEAGDLDAAEVLLSCAVRVVKRHRGADIMAALVDGTTLYVDATGDGYLHQLAARAITWREGVAGADTQLVACLLNGLAVVDHCRGHIDRAEVRLRRALDVLANDAGDLPLLFATVVSNLAATYSDRGEHQRARIALCELIRAMETTLGADHPDLAHKCVDLGLVDFEQGELDSAETSFRRAARLAESRQGRGHPDLASALTNLARILIEKNVPVHARPLLVRALEIRDAAFGPTHTATTTVLLLLAEVHQDLGEYDEAEPLLLRALTIEETIVVPPGRDLALTLHRLLGPDHPDIATVLENLSDVYRTLGAPAESERLLLRALRLREMALGPNNTHVATTLVKLGAAYVALGDHARAEPLYGRARQIFQASVGPGHPHVAMVLEHVGELYRAAGMSERADAAERQAREIYVRCYVPHADA